jgi:hypothetical protein
VFSKAAAMVIHTLESMQAVAVGSGADVYTLGTGPGCC